MKAYTVMLALFIIGCVTQAVNTNEIGVSIPHQEVSVNETTVSEVTDLSNTDSEGSMFMFWNVRVMIKMMGVLMSGFATVLSVIPLLLSFGIPLSIATMIQLPIWIVEIWGIAQFLTGRQTKTME